MQVENGEVFLQVIISVYTVDEGVLELCFALRGAHVHGMLLCSLRSLVKQVKWICVPGIQGRGCKSCKRGSRMRLGCRERPFRWPGLRR